MKLRILIASLISLGGAGLSHAEGRSPAAPEKLKLFLAQFNKAVAAGDAKALVALTHFPLRMHIEGTKPTFSKKEFETSFRQDLSSYCGQTKALERDEDGKRWLADCNGDVFYFAEFGGEWKYGEHENINE